MPPTNAERSTHRPGESTRTDEPTDTTVLEAALELARETSTRCRLELTALGVTIEAAPDADACVRWGCRQGEQLVKATIEGVGPRVVCPDHLPDLVEEKAINA